VPEIRTAALRSLAYMEAPDVRKTLREAVRSRGPEDVRAEAARLLGQVGRIEDVEPLAGCLSGCPASVAAEAASSLSRLTFLGAGRSESDWLRWMHDFKPAATPETEKRKLLRPWGALDYLEAGKGAPVVVVGDGPEVAAGLSLAEVAPLAASRRLYAPDLRGRGSVSLVADAADVAALVARVAPRGGASLVGHGYGAHVVLACLASGCRGVERAVLVSPPAPLRRGLVDALSRTLGAARPPYRDDLALCSTPAGGLGTVAGDRACGDALLAVLASGARDRVLGLKGLWHGPARQRRTMDTLERYDLRDAMDHAEVPLLVVTGKLDPSVSVAPYTAARSRPTALVLDAAGHFPGVEAPKEFMDAVDEFLR
jgi:pimeloyl-ACP methyl ester carboxylesterase